MNSELKEMEMTDYNILKNLAAAFYRIWKLKLVIVLATIIGLLLSIAYKTYKGDKYKYYSSATIYSAVYGSYSETVSGVTIMNTYSSVFGSKRVCERAAVYINDSKITANYLMNLVSSGRVTLSGASTESRKYGYRLVLNSVMDTPENVVAITNAMAAAYTEEINELLGQDVLQVFDQASSFGVSKDIADGLLMLIFAGAAFFISLIVIFIKEFFSSKVYLISQCEQDNDLILGLIPYAKKGSSN